MDDAKQSLGSKGCRWSTLCYLNRYSVFVCKSGKTFILLARIDDTNKHIAMTTEVRVV